MQSTILPLYSTFRVLVYAFVSLDFRVPLFRPSVRPFTRLLGSNTLTSVPLAPRVRRGLYQTRDIGNIWIGKLRRDL